MIDVNVITELLIQHSQSTGFEKSLEMLTQTLRQLTDPTAAPKPPKTKTREWADSLIFAIVAATLIRWATFEAYTIPSPSMEA